MITKKYLPLFLLPFLLFRCSPSKESLYKFDAEEHIIFEEIPYPGLLGETMQLIKWDDFLFVNDYFGDSLIHVFNLNSEQLEKKLISKGEGPNEGISPLELQLVEDSLYVLSRPLYSLSHIELTALNNEQVTLHKDLQLPPLSDCFVSLGNSRFAFSGLWKKRYAYLDLKKSQELREFGEFPDYWEDEKEFSAAVRAFFHQCFFVKHPTENLFVSCSGYVLEIYTFDPVENELPQLHFKKMLGKYSYDFVDGEMVSAQARKGSDPGVKTVACSENYIYLVISQKEDRKKRNIIVLDWDGRPVKLLKSDKEITCLAVDEKAKKGYCIIKDPEDKLVTFDLSL